MTKLSQFFTSNPDDQIRIEYNFQDRKRTYYLKYFDKTVYCFRYISNAPDTLQISGQRISDDIFQNLLKKYQEFFKLFKNESKETLDDKFFNAEKNKASKQRYESNARENNARESNRQPNSRISPWLNEKVKEITNECDTMEEAIIKLAEQNIQLNAFMLNDMKKIINFKRFKARSSINIK